MISQNIKEKIKSPASGGVSKVDSVLRFGDESRMIYASMRSSNLSAQGRSTSPRSMVTIAMSIKFDRKSSTIGALYYKDLAKMANLLKENPSLIATLESCEVENLSPVSLEIARIRLRNVLNYLVGNFDISASRFYVDKLIRPISFNPAPVNIPSFSDSSEESPHGCSRVTLTLKYPSMFS